MMMTIVLNKTSDSVNTPSVYYILPEQVCVLFYWNEENFEGTLMNAIEKFIFVKSFTAAAPLLYFYLPSVYFICLSGLISKLGWLLRNCLNFSRKVFLRFLWLFLTYTLIVFKSLLTIILTSAAITTAQYFFCSNRGLLTKRGNSFCKIISSFEEFLSKWCLVKLSQS